MWALLQNQNATYSACLPWCLVSDVQAINSVLPGQHGTRCQTACETHTTPVVLPYSHHGGDLHCLYVFAGINKNCAESHLAQNETARIAGPMDSLAHSDPLLTCTALSALQAISSISRTQADVQNATLNNLRNSFTWFCEEDPAPVRMVDPNLLRIESCGVTHEYPEPVGNFVLNA